MAAEELCVIASIMVHNVYVEVIAHVMPVNKVTVGLIVMDHGIVMTLHEMHVVISMIIHLQL